MNKWSGLVFAVAAIATSACASSGYTPRPFPMPAGHHSPALPETPGTPSSPTTPGSSVGPIAGPTANGLAGPMDTYALVGTALALRGTPYRNGGTDQSGFDCSGFTQYVFAQYGVSLPRAVREQYQQGKSIDQAELAPGDLVFFTTLEPGASHVAILVGGDEFIHAPSSTGVVRVEHLSSSYWSQRYLGARRVN